MDEYFTDLDPRYANIADAETIGGAWTFDRDPNPPFAVSVGSGKVDNLDADLLDGRDESEFALADKSRPSPWVAETDVPVLTDAKYPNALLLDGSRTPIADIPFGGYAIINVGDVDGVDISSHVADSDAHHSQLHQATHLTGGSDLFEHVHNVLSANQYEATETVITDTTWTLYNWIDLLGISKDDIWFNFMVGLEALLASPLPARGADIRLTQQISGQSEVEMETFRIEGTDWWDFKQFFISYWFPTGVKGQNLKFRVYFKVDDSNYSLTIRKRTLLVFADATKKTPLAP